MFALLVQILIILVVINTARRRRAKCNWQLEQAQKRMRLGIVGVVVALSLPPLIPAMQPASPAAILTVMLMLYSVFILSRALYRKTDLRKSPYNAQKAEMSKQETGHSGPEA